MLIITKRRGEPWCTSLTKAHLELGPWSKMRCHLANDVFTGQVLHVLREHTSGTDGTQFYINIFSRLRHVFGKDPSVNYPVCCVDDFRLLELTKLGEEFQQWRVEAMRENPKDWAKTVPSYQLFRSMCLLCNAVPFIVRYFNGKRELPFGTLHGEYLSALEA